MGDVRPGVPQAPPLPRLLGSRGAGAPALPGSLLTALHFLGILPARSEAGEWKSLSVAAAVGVRFKRTEGRNNCSQALFVFSTRSQRNLEVSKSVVFCFHLWFVQNTQLTLEEVCFMFLSRSKQTTELKENSDVLFFERACFGCFLHQQTQHLKSEF